MGLSYRATRRLLSGIIIAVIAVAATACILCPWFLLRASAKQAALFLQEHSAQNARHISARLSTVFSALETISDTYAHAPLKSRSSYLARQEEGAAIRLNLIAADEASPFDGEPFLGQALAGKNAVSELTSFENTTGFIFAVPLVEKGAVTGALLGYYPIDALRELLAPPEVANGAHAMIISGDGSIPLYYPVSQTPAETNFFSYLQEHADDFPKDTLEKIRADIGNRAAGILDVDLAQPGGKSICCYDSIDNTGWYLFSFIPAAVLWENARPFMNVSIGAIITIVALFLCMLLLLFLSSRKKQLQLEQLAYIDPVTDGMSLSLFDKKATQLLSGNPPSSYALVIFDIQRFKLINNARGSEAGNDALRYIYNIFARSLVQDELITRVSGDYFNLLLRNESRARIVERIEAAARELNAFNEERTIKFYLPIRAGIYIVDDLALDLITIRDRANVAWKNNGDTVRNRISSCSFYTDFERMKLLREKEIDGRIEAALENREFAVYFQPKYELSGETLSGAEALVRWNDPDRGIIPPAEFIPVLEKNALIGKLDLYVFDTVCRHLQEWDRQGRKLIPISVNLSRVYLQTPGFLQEFKRIFDQYDISPRYIEFEITETVIFEDLAAFIRVVDEIHAMGFSCSLDDFGSGYSSLNVLKNVPVDVLKLDRAFLNGKILSDQRERYVVESVILLAHRLNMQTVCEGVETVPQLEFLKNAGCDIVQGYVYSRPLPLREFELLPF